MGKRPVAVALVAGLLVLGDVSAQEMVRGAIVEAERVIVTGSNIPTAEEVGPNPVDTYRREDIEKLGIRNATDLTTFLPQQAGGAMNQNFGASGDGTVQFNLRGLLAKETLVLVDGNRVALGTLNAVEFSGGVDINLLPFPMIDHIDILKDGASAVYGSDAITGVVNFFLVHKFRGLEIGGSYGNTNLGASNDMGEWEAWLKAGTGDDKTDIVVIADFWERTGGLFSRDRDISSNGNFTRLGGFDTRSGNEPCRIGSFRWSPKLFFSANSPPPHSAPNAATSPFYIRPQALGFLNGTLPGTDGDYVFFNFAAFTPALPSADRQAFYGSFTRDLCDKYLVLFADFKYVRSFFDSSLAAVPFVPDPFKIPGLNVGFSPLGISVPISNPFNPFIGLLGHNSKAARSGLYVTLQNTGQFELPLGYATINGDLFNLPAGPVAFAIGGEYRAERLTRDRDPLNSTFQSIGSVDGQGFLVNRDVWSIYQEVRVPFTSPRWNFPGFYSFEVDFAERQEWYSQNTSTVLAPFQPAISSQYNGQRPKVSVRWQPIDPKYIGAVTLRSSYTEAFHAPTLFEMTPAGSQNFALVRDPFSRLSPDQVEERISGNPLLQPEVAYEWSYGIVYSPKWLKGMTLSADWWHIDLRSLISSLGAQFIIEADLPGLVFRTPPPPGTPPLANGQPDRGAVTLVIDPNDNLSGAIFEGLDYEAIYLLDSGIFGHGDFGRLTFTVNGSWLSRAELQVNPDPKRFGIASEFLPRRLRLTSSLPWNRANFSLFYDGPAYTWTQGLDIGAVVHWVGQYEDDNVDLTGSPKLNMPRTGGPGDNAAPFPQRARKVADWSTFDLIASYTFNLSPPAPAPVPGFAKDGGKNVKMQDGKEKNVLPVSTAEYNPCGWSAWLNGTTITLGMQNVFDEDPPFVAGAFENNYDESLADVRGRFWYVQLKKRF